MRLNRTNAQFRDRDRLGSTSKGNIQDMACAQLWQELVGMSSTFEFMAKLRSRIECVLDNWKRRIDIVDYCVSVVDQSMEEKRKRLEHQDQGDAASQRRTQAELFADEVKVCSYRLCNLEDFLKDMNNYSATKSIMKLRLRRLSANGRWTVCDHFNEHARSY